MSTFKAAILTAAIIVSGPVLAQTAGNTQNTGPEGAGNFVAGTAPSENTGPEGSGNYVAGQTNRYAAPVSGSPQTTASPGLARSK